MLVGVKAIGFIVSIMCRPQQQQKGENKMKTETRNKVQKVRAGTKLTRRRRERLSCNFQGQATHHLYSHLPPTQSAAYALFPVLCRILYFRAHIPL